MSLVIYSKRRWMNASIALLFQKNNGLMLIIPYKELWARSLRNTRINTHPLREVWIIKIKMKIYFQDHTRQTNTRKEFCANPIWPILFSSVYLGIQKKTIRCFSCSIVVIVCFGTYWSWFMISSCKKKELKV